MKKQPTALPLDESRCSHCGEPTLTIPKRYAQLAEKPKVVSAVCFSCHQCTRVTLTPERKAS